MSLLTKVLDPRAIKNFFQSLGRFFFPKKEDNEWRSDLEAWRIAMADPVCLREGKCKRCLCQIPSTIKFPGLEKGDMPCDGACFPFAPQTKLGWKGYQLDNMVSHISLSTIDARFFKDAVVPVEINEEENGVRVTFLYKNNTALFSTRQSIDALAYQLKRTNIISVKKVVIGYED